MRRSSDAFMANQSCWLVGAWPAFRDRVQQALAAARLKPTRTVVEEQLPAESEDWCAPLARPLARGEIDRIEEIGQLR